MEAKIKHLCEALWNIKSMRSITGQGLRDAYKILDSICELDRMTFKTGQKVGDWTIPKEWVFRKAEVLDTKGNVLISTDNHKLHVANYSNPVDKVMKIKDFEKHVYTHDFIPYKTLYYDDDWGICMTKDDWNLISIDHNKVHVKIDSEFIDGSMDVAYRHFGNLAIGSGGEDYLFSAYCCHPQTAHSGLSGMVINIMLADYVSKMKKLKNKYLFLFCPKTIGAIAAIEGMALDKGRGFMVHCCGAAGPPQEYLHYPGFGGDDRQFELAGIKMSSIMTMLPEQYYKYNTSGDDLETLNYKTMELIYNIYVERINFLEKNRKPKRKFNSEPFLKKHGIEFKTKEEMRQFMRVWHGADGTRDFEKIHEEYGVARGKIIEYIDIMEEKGLLCR